MASPMEMPMMPDSASGVSMTRCSPKSLSRPSVMRKTPPSVPTSSPRRTTLPSASMASRSAVLSALAMVIFAIPSALIGDELALEPLQPFELPQQRDRWIGVDVVHQVLERRRRHLFDRATDPGGGGVRLALGGAVQLVRPQPSLLEEGAVAADGLARHPHVQVVGGPVARRVVGGGVGAEPVGHRLDQGRATAFASPVRGH